MVTQQILVLFFLVRIQVAQLFILLLFLFIGLWCNGNTTDSGPVFLGSNPGSPTEEDRSGDLFLYLYFSLHCALEKIVGMKCSVAPDEIGKSLGSFEKPVG